MYTCTSGTTADGAGGAGGSGDAGGAGGVRVRTRVRTRYSVLTMLCHIGKGHTYVRTRVYQWYTYTSGTYVYVPNGTYLYNVMSQLSDWKRAHLLMCTESHMRTYHWYSSTML